jgi:outer membrane lipase/esterase
MQFVRHTFSLSVLALTLAQSAHAAQFSNVFAFGDSLSDAGQYGAHFTTNPGFTAIEDVGSYFGSTLKPSTQGGTDYAYGGARISTQETYSPQATPVAGQVTSLLSKGPLVPTHSTRCGAGRMTSSTTSGWPEREPKAPPRCRPR